MTCSCCHAATFPSQGSPAGRASVSTTPNSGSRPRCSPFCSEMSVQLEGTARAGGSPGLRVRAGRRAWGQVLGAGPWRWAGFTPTYLLLSHSGHRDPRSAQASGWCSVLSRSVQPQPGAADPPARGSMTPPPSSSHLTGMFLQALSPNLFPLPRYIWSHTELSPSHFWIFIGSTC